MLIAIIFWHDRVLRKRFFLYLFLDKNAFSHSRSLTETTIATSERKGRKMSIHEIIERMVGMAVWVGDAEFNFAAPDWAAVSGIPEEVPAAAAGRVLAELVTHGRHQPGALGRRLIQSPFSVAAAVEARCGFWLNSWSWIRREIEWGNFEA